MSKRNDITAKIFALIIAIILWSYVMDRENPIRPAEIRNVTVAFSNVSALERQNLVIMEPHEVTVNVRVEGATNELNKDRFSARNIVAQVDLSGYGEGQVKVPVTVGLINQGQTVRVLNWEPKEILFTLDKRISVDKPVTIKTIGELPEGYVLGDLTTKSQTVQLTGPRTWVNEVSEAIVEVNINDRTTPDSVLAPVRILSDTGNDVRGVEKEPTLIEVNIPVYRKVTLPIELQTVNELPENLVLTDINISPSTIEVKGDNDVVNLTKIVTKPIDINSLLDQKAIELELDLPEGVTLVNPNDKVTMFYNIEENTSREFVLTTENLRVLNLDKNLIMDDLDPDTEIRVTLKGISSVLDTINEEDIGIYIDLIDLDTGTHQVDIQIEYIQESMIESIDPMQLTINIREP